MIIIHACTDVKSVRVYWRLLHEFMLWPKPVGSRHAITVDALQNASALEFSSNSLSHLNQILPKCCSVCLLNPVVKLHNA